MRIQLLSSLLALFATTYPQGVETPDISEAGDLARPDVQVELSAWRDLHGANWQVIRDHEDGFAELLHGGDALPDFQPSSDEDWFRVELLAAANYLFTLYTVDDARLELFSAVGARLAQAGSLDPALGRRIEFRPESAGARNDHGRHTLHQIRSQSLR